MLVWDNLNTHRGQVMRRMTALAKTRLTRMQHRPDLIEGFLAKIGLGPHF